MANVENEFVSSVEKENKTGVYRIHSIWKNDSVQVNVAANDAAWSGEVSKVLLQH